MQQQDLVDDVSCTVCLEVFDRPRNLPCGHAFCTPCLETLCDAGRRECPVCRRAFVGHAVSFPIAVQLQSIADRVRSADGPQAGRSPSPPAAAVVGPLPSAPPLAVVVGCADARRLRFGCRIAVSQEQTATLFSAWLAGLWLAPHTLAIAAVLGRLQVRWVPFYLMQCGTMTTFSGTVVTHRATTTGSQAHRDAINESYVQNSFRYSDRRFVFAGIDDEPLRRLWDPMTHTDELVEVEVPGDERVQSAASIFAHWVEPRVRALCRDKALEQLRRPFAGIQSANIATCHTVFENRTDTLVYMPMYVGTYVYEDSHYPVVIHGATGEVQGERPYGSGVIGRTVDWIASRYVQWGSGRFLNLDATGSVGSWSRYLFGGGGNGDDPDQPQKESQ